MFINVKKALVKRRIIMKTYNANDKQRHEYDEAAINAILTTCKNIKPRNEDVNNNKLMRKR